jgi:hypothetical protein
MVRKNFRASINAYILMYESHYGQTYKFENLGLEKTNIAEMQQKDNKLMVEINKDTHKKYK